MLKTKIIKKRDAEFQKLEVLKTNRAKRTHYGEFLVEGVRNINEAVKNCWKVVSWVYPHGTTLSDWAKNYITNVPATVNLALEPNLMRDISGKSDTSELMAILEMRNLPFDIFNNDSLIAVFDRPSNRGNLGTIIRSCDAFGIGGLIVTGHGADLYDADTITATMGSFFNVKTARAESNEQLTEWIKRCGLNVIATTAHSEKSIYDVDFTRPSLILIGNETDGLSNFLYSISDEIATIPMAACSSASSLNVACAASIIFCEARRQLFTQSSHFSH